MNQLHAYFAFQSRNMMTQGWLRQMQTSCRFRYIHAFRKGNEFSQVRQVHGIPPTEQVRGNYSKFCQPTYLHSAVKPTLDGAVRR